MSKLFWRGVRKCLIPQVLSGCAQKAVACNPNAIQGRAKTPVIFLKHSLTKGGNVRLNKSSTVAKQVYKSPEFISKMKELEGPMCVKTQIKFSKSKHLHATFLEATLSGTIDANGGGFIFKGYLFDKYDFRKSKNAKVKPTFPK